MVSKNQIKLIKSLQHKKYRLLNGLFIAEGVKVIQEFLQSNIVLEHLYETDNLFPNVDKEKKTRITPNELMKISAMATSSP
ncbi:MAG: hypothetical protein ACKPKO_56915 [Candidatus Fonsibacter sp.]